MSSQTSPATPPREWGMLCGDNGEAVVGVGAWVSTSDLAHERTSKTVAPGTDSPEAVRTARVEDVKMGAGDSRGYVRRLSTVPSSGLRDRDRDRDRDRNRTRRRR
jgi:hypothetical protein